MDKFVARANIAHYREKLATETDDTELQMLRRLLAEEEAKLATLENDPSKKEARDLARVLPFAPMGRLHVEPLLSFRLRPTAKNTPARKHKRMYAIVVDDGQFQIAVERRGGYGLPLHSEIVCSRQSSALI